MSYTGLICFNTTSPNFYATISAANLFDEAGVGYDSTAYVRRNKKFGSQVSLMRKHYV